MIHNDLKLALKLKLIGDTDVLFQFIRIHPKIKKYQFDVFYMDDANEYMLIKSDSDCELGQYRLVIPPEVSVKNNGKCLASFASNHHRYMALKRLSKSLINFSKSYHFRDCSVPSESRILFFNENWFVY